MAQPPSDRSRAATPFIEAGLSELDAVPFPGASSSGWRWSLSCFNAATSARRTLSGSAPKVSAIAVATRGQRGGSRLDFRDSGHFTHARTIRSSGSARSFAATLLACARLLYGFALNMKIRPERTQMW